MTTEILGFIIIVGAIIVLLARWQLQKAEEDPEVMEASAGRLRYELEQSADEIINRMAGHIDHLEGLLREADYKAEMLQQRINELQKMQMDSPVDQSAAEPQPEAEHNLEVEPHFADEHQLMDISEDAVYEEHKLAETLIADESQNEGQDFSELLESNIQDPNLAVPENVEYIDDSDAQEYIEKTDTEEYIEGSEVEEHLESGMDSGISQEAQLALEAFREVSKNLEAAQNDMGLHIDISSEPEEMSMMDSGYEAVAENEPVPESGYEAEQGQVAESLEDGQESKEEETFIEDPEIEDKDDATEIAKKLLMAGYTPEDVARFTGLGMNAIALLRQIHKI
ncbi:hypothetical protein [Anaerovibrio sp. RM50]|uniref:hypothetical protein n=1 Tax=Anaerovibrio sp. RM50 TaxID=1200557 RepID=UPI000487DA20|nr:hypothetical protein [Anaerovibrio sp. RM50]